jgi:phenylacetate-CoA ligase
MGFYDRFCVTPDDGIAEFWRSGGATGAPLFYPRSFEDISYAMVGFARIYQCAGCSRGGRAHVSFPLGIHPVGQMLARCATEVGIAVNWAGSGTTTPSVMQIELIDRLKPTIWMGMSSYGLHLWPIWPRRAVSILRPAPSRRSCAPPSRCPTPSGKKLSRQWGAQVRDTFGMTEAGMMGAEDSGGGGFRVWTDMFLIEVLDPDTNAPVGEGEMGCLVVTPLWTNNVTPFLRWSSGDLVTWHEAGEGSGPFSVFPLVKHAHRTTGFFKVRGINLNHSEFEDFMFRDAAVADFKAELISARDLDVLRLSIEVRRGTPPAPVSDGLQTTVRDTFGLTPEIVVLDAGTLAKEFEASVKTPRFVDRRQ